MHQHAYDFTVRLPANVSGMAQVEEYFILVQNGQERKIRLHDYDEMYRIPGLYEKVIADILQCRSPDVIAALLTEQAALAGVSAAELSVLDLGAGTGMIGEALHKYGVNKVVGIDIIPEAAESVRQLRPHTYNAYYVEDMCNLSDQTRREMEAAQFNCLVCGSALGIHHIPPAVFTSGYDLIEEHGWIAFNIRAESLGGDQETRFSRFIVQAIEEGKIEVKVTHTYRHRLAVDGSPINYTAIIGRKLAPLSAA